MGDETADSRRVNVLEKTSTNKNGCEEVNGIHNDSLDNVIDDQEFDIPPLQYLPTLESILNAPDDDELQPQTGFLVEGLNSADNWEVASVSSQESYTALGTSTPRKNSKAAKIQASEKHGVVFRHVKLKSISSQLLSAADKVDAGMPTCLAVSTLIAVGTSHGLVLVFDSKQALRWCLGSTAVGAQYGAVSALSFNVDCTRLLCGFARGQITMWNLTNGKLLRTVLDAHPPGTAILHVKFTDDRTVAITSDSGGSVFQLEFKRTMGVRSCDSNCLFSGSRGEACVVDPLCTHQIVPDHPMKDVSILAMASLSKVLVVVIKPHVKVHYVRPLPGDPSTLPLLSWQYVVIQVSENNRILDPVLAFARDQSIFFAQVVCLGIDDIKVTLLQEMKLPYKLLAMTWINSRSMVLVDTSERAHLVDVKSEEEIQVLDLADVQLVYSTSFYKSLATGGNVSRALAYAGDRACYQSMVTFNSQLVLLGTRGVHVLTLRSWLERINALVKQGKHRQALDLGLAFHKGEGKAVVGLSWNPAKRKSTIDDFMRNVLLQYVDSTLAAAARLGLGREGDEESKVQLREMADACLSYCIASEVSEFIFSDVYERLCKVQMARGVFLESLKPFILDDVLNYITPSVTQDFIECFKVKGDLETVESCILHLDFSSLDIHQVVSLCRSHKLHDALFHVYNKGLGDYVAPLVDLLDRLSATPEDESLGNKILVYVSCCLSGRAYPFGEIPEDKVGAVREQVLLCITSLHGPSSPEDGRPLYPYLRTLVAFNTGEFFNALSLAFRDSQLQAREKQRVVDILLLLMIDNGGFSPSQIGILFVFLGRQISQGNSEINVDPGLFEQVLETLCTSDRSRHEEREQIMIDLLDTGILERFLEGHPQEELKLVTLASSAGFHRAVELLHVRQRQFGLALATYWNDPTRGDEMFDFIAGVLSDGSMTSEERESFKRDVIENLNHLLKVDPKRSAKMILHGFGADVSDILARFEHEERTLFQFLQGTFEHWKGTKSERSYKSKKAPMIDATVLERYVELMCKFDVPQEDVIEFLSTNGDYRNDVVLGTCKRHSRRDVMCFLLERSGDLSAAFSLSLEILSEHMASDEDKSSAEARISGMLDFLQRNARSMTTEQTHAFWFELLDLVLKKQQELKLHPTDGSREVSTREGPTADWARRETSRIVTAGMPYLPPSLILRKIVSSPAYAAGRFSELRGLMTDVMETCNYERVLMKTCAKMAADELVSRVGRLKESAGKAVSSGCSNLCGICSRKILLSSRGTAAAAAAAAVEEEHDQIVSFHCGHAYHVTCMSSLAQQESTSENDLRCHVCRKSDLTLKKRFESKNPTSAGLSSDDGTVNGDSHLRGIFQSQKSPSYMSILSSLDSKRVHHSKQRKGNVFQSEEWLSQKLAAPPV